MTATRLSWLELNAPALAQARAFYGAVFGWQSEPISPRAHPHAWLSREGVHFAGVSERDPAEAKPEWAGFVQVSDLDAALERAKALNAPLLGEPGELPGLVRFCRIADPDGRPLGLFQALGGDIHGPIPTGLNDPIGWRQIASPDPERLSEFLAGLLDWQELDRFDIGPAGPYRILGTGGQPHVGMMRLIPGEPEGWLFYFDTPDLTAALAAVTAQGGRVITETMEVPGGAIISHAFDPGMAKFGLIQMPG